MASTIQIRVDDDLKNKSDQLFKDLGTDTTYKECLLLRFEEVRQNYVRLLLVLLSGREEKTL